MPAILANVPNFRLTTDYSLDKIVYLKTGSFVVPAFSAATDPVAHGLTFTPLMDGTWSTDPTFSLSYDMGSGPASTVSGNLFNIAPEVSANATNTIVEATNVTGAAVTVYYRIFGLEPSTVNLVAPHTNNLADTFIINTDFNYTKLFQKDRVTSNTTITHNIGHRSQVCLWEELSGTIRKKNENRPTNPFGDGTSAIVGINSLAVAFDPFVPAGTAVHYRIYIDE